MAIYMWRDVTGAGIYWNSGLGLITIADGNGNDITIADKNLGATSTDTSSTNSYGYFYQRGNNYGFPSTGTITTSSTRVNASTYGPGNYFNAGNFIALSVSGNYFYWDTSANTNKWGGETNTVEAMQGPCDAGYHIPSNDEITALTTIITGLGLQASDIPTYLKIPTSGSRNGGDGSLKTSTGLWTAKYKQLANSNKTVVVYMRGGTLTTSVEGNGNPIRPFKNITVQPNETRTKLY